MDKWCSVCNMNWTQRQGTSTFSRKSYGKNSTQKEPLGHLKLNQTIFVIVQPRREILSIFCTTHMVKYHQAHDLLQDFDWFSNTQTLDYMFVDFAAIFARRWQAVSGSQQIRHSQQEWKCLSIHVPPAFPKLYSRFAQKLSFYYGLRDAHKFIMWCHVTSWCHTVTSPDVMTSYWHEVTPKAIMISHGNSLQAKAWKSHFLTLWPWPYA